MYARINTGQTKPGAVDEVIRVWDTQIMASLTKQKGYKGYQMFIDRGGNKTVTITYWETREDADATINADYMQQARSSLANHFAAPLTQEHYEVERDERA